VIRADESVETIPTKHMLHVTYELFTDCRASETCSRKVTT